MNIPLSLTLIRLVIAPWLLSLCIFIFPKTLFWQSILALSVVTIGLTDFFDGFLARRFKQETDMGRLLDPLADKFFVIMTLFTLIFVGKLSTIWAYCVVGRELLVTGLREIALTKGFSLPVSLIGKIKTVLQVLLCATALVAEYSAHNSLAFYGYYLLSSITFSVTLYSGGSYFYTFWKNYLNLPGKLKK